MTVQESAQRILTNVETNEKQILEGIKQMHTSIEVAEKKISDMEVALAEVKVLKTAMLVVISQPAMAEAIESALVTVDG